MSDSRASRGSEAPAAGTGRGWLRGLGASGISTGAGERRFVAEPPRSDLGKVQAQRLGA